MTPPISRLRRNLAVRCRLLRAALFKRAIQEDVFAVAEKNYMPYRDVIAEIDPFEFVGVNPGPADFQTIPAPASFLGPDDPPYYVSEAGVSRFLARLAVHRSSTTILELGCFVGWTTAHLARAAEHLGGNAHVWAVELDGPRARLAERNLSTQPGAARVTFLAGSSLDPSLHERLPRGLDLVFIDTLHTYETTRREIEIYGARLNPGGCLVLHDSLSFGGVRKAITDAGDHYARFTFASVHGNGMSVIVPRAIR